MAKAPPAERKAETLQQLRANEAHTKSRGESACSPPTWMERPSLAKCTCRCSGIAALAILLGKWDLSRNSLFKSNSFTWSATASFLCRPNGRWKHLLLIRYRYLIARLKANVKPESANISPVCRPGEFHWFQSRTWTTLPLVCNGKIHQLVPLLDKLLIIYCYRYGNEKFEEDTLKNMNIWFYFGYTKNKSRGYKSNY